MIRFAQRLAVVMAAALLLAALVGATPATARGLGWTHRDSHACGKAAAGEAQCTAIARSLFHDGKAFHAGTRSALATAAAADLVGYVNGSTIRTAYGITAQGDPSRVVAIVDAYDNPNAYANLTRFRSDAGLPAIPSCTLAALTALTSSATSPCFTKVNQSGGTTLPKADSGWSLEMDLDLQAASAVCPMCSILLLEASSTSFTNLGAAVTTASNTAHVLAISNSYGAGGDYPATLAPAYDNAALKGIAVMASSGDGGYGPEFPASATNVIAVGGTTLTVSDTTGIRTTEAAWSGSGSGCSVYNAAPAWQSIPGNPCAGKKAIADVSADADPNSGLATFTTNGGVTGYWIVGGTSLASPLVAAQYAELGGFGPSLLAGKYAWAAGTPAFDVTTGSNGTCSPSVLCTAGVGWDGPTGLGSFAVSSAPQVLTSISVSPPSASVQTGATQPFSATAKDQNGQPMSPQPTFAWSLDGGGAISASGVFTAGSTAGGPYTVTASSGGLNGTAQVTVTTVPPDFKIAISPSSQSVKRGNTATYQVTIMLLNGLAGPVGLSVSGQPAGSTATFTPASTTAASTLTVKTSTSTSRRTYTLTIKGVDGSVSHTTNVSLTVTR